MPQNSTTDKKSVQEPEFKFEMPVKQTFKNQFENPLDKYKVQLEQLRLMETGYSDAQLIALLDQNGGDFEKVVNAIFTMQ